MKTAEYYERYWNADEPIPEKDPTTPARERLLLSSLRRVAAPAGRPLRVLDAGCGSGWFVERLTRAGYEAHGVDLSTAAVAEAKKRCPEATLLAASLEERLPYPDGHFDAVWSTEVIEHVFDPQAFLAELARVLRPGGMLVLTTPFHGRAKNVAIALAGFDRHYDPVGPHIRFFTVASLSRILLENGFEVPAWSGVGRFWPLYKSMFVTARRAA